jgi:starvation-inducible outer membrane lipoprotein
MKTRTNRLSLIFACLIALSLAACATQPPPPPDIPPPPKRKLDAKTQLETGRSY